MEYEFNTGDPVPLRFSKWLQWAIARSGIEKQTTLEARSGVSRQYINALLAAAEGRIDKGKRPSKEMACKLARGLGRPESEALLAAGYADLPVTTTPTVAARDWSPVEFFDADRLTKEEYRERAKIAIEIAQAEIRRLIALEEKERAEKEKRQKDSNDE